MPRTAADVDADDRALRPRQSRAADDEHDLGRVGVDLGRHAPRGQSLGDCVLDDPAKLKWRRFEIDRGTDLDREAQRRAAREPVVRRQRRQQVIEERLEAHCGAGAQIPGDARRRAVIARGDPGDRRHEGIEQRRFALPLRLLDPHAERRAHHEALQLRLHDPVGAARARQAQLVTAVCAHAFPAPFISSTLAP